MDRGCLLDKRCLFGHLQYTTYISLPTLRVSCLQEGYSRVDDDDDDGEDCGVDDDHDEHEDDKHYYGENRTQFAIKVV